MVKDDVSESSSSLGSAASSLNFSISVPLRLSKSSIRFISIWFCFIRLSWALWIDPESSWDCCLKSLACLCSWSAFCNASCIYASWIICMIPMSVGPVPIPAPFNLLISSFFLILCVWNSLIMVNALGISAWPALYFLKNLQSAALNFFLTRERTSSGSRLFILKRKKSKSVSFSSNFSLMSSSWSAS